MPANEIRSSENVSLMQEYLQKSAKLLRRFDAPPHSACDVERAKAVGSQMGKPI
jgi:hypothetical protein